MNGKFALLALIATFVMAMPAAAQDTSAVGRERQGVTEQPGAAVQPQAPDTAGLTTREGIEGDTGVTDPAATTEEREMAADEGAEMPRTASPLPALALAGGLLVVFGLGLRLVAGRRS